MALLIGLFLMPAARAFGGPPFLTDGPEPTDFRHWEIYLLPWPTGSAAVTQ
jgi:hypothetical protein